MEKWDTIRTRRNVREYTDEPIARMSSASLRRDGEHRHRETLTPMVDAVRGLAMGHGGEALVEHSASYYVVLSLAWSAAIFMPAEGPGRANP